MSAKPASEATAERKHRLMHNRVTEVDRLEKEIGILFFLKEEPEASLQSILESRR